MFRLSRTSVIAWTAVEAVIAALSYLVRGVAEGLHKFYAHARKLEQYAQARVTQTMAI